MSKKLNGFIAGVLCTAALGGLAYGGIKVYKQYIYKPADNISATIDGKEYENLEDAFSYGAPLTLQKDITADGMLTINTSVVIDMNAHKITSPVNVVGNTITLKNGVIENSVVVDKGSTLILDNVKLSTADVAIHVYGKLIVKNTEIQSLEKDAIYLHGNAKLEVVDSVVTGAYRALATQTPYYGQDPYTTKDNSEKEFDEEGNRIVDDTTDCTAEITNSTFTSTGEFASYTIGVSSSVNDRWDDTPIYWACSGKLTINSGTFKAL